MRGLPPKRLISSLHYYYKCTTAWFHVKATIAEEWSAWSQRLYHKPSSTEIATIVGDLFSYNGCHPRPSSLAILAGLQNTSLWSVQIAKSGQCLLCVYVFSFFFYKFCLKFSLNTHTCTHTIKHSKAFIFLSPWCFFLLSFLLLSSIPTSRNSDLGQRLSSFTTARRFLVWWSVKSGGLFSLQTCESRLGERSIELTLRADTSLPDLLYVLTLAAVSTLVLPVLKECSLLILQICISQFCNSATGI